MVMFLQLLGIISITLAILCIPNVAASHQVPSDEERLVSTVQEFFTSWFVNRDIKKAMKYISTTPIIGKCAAPDDLEKREPISQRAIMGAFQQLFTNGLGAVARKSRLSDLLESPGYISPNDRNVTTVNHPAKQYFEIFRLNVKRVEDEVRYICKFDERQSFREAVSRPNVYYVVTRVKVDDPKDNVELVLLWVKEGRAWRILTIAAPEY